ncbi:uncharacterized protein M6B38_191480 [Iris pallida]|uniref:Uncharacterized protein n=1 Tax=Iris pallida TaxID=29817 RepID=A0AAX6EFN5_IRIPA|nr:uncharacterized protein M6B38_191480 [Iris pallida]
MNDSVMTTDCGLSAGTNDHNDNGLEEKSNETDIKDHASQGDSRKPIGELTEQSRMLEIEDDTVDVNMEASILADDVLRAGGFGARDDIGSFLPVAIDSTDFEASLRDAKDFEEPQGEILRPGLGWTGSRDKE